MISSEVVHKGGKWWGYFTFEEGENKTKVWSVQLWLSFCPPPTIPILGCNQPLFMSVLLGIAAPQMAACKWGPGFKWQPGREWWWNSSTNSHYSQPGCIHKPWPKSLPTAPYSSLGGPHSWAAIWGDQFHGREIHNKTTLAQRPYFRFFPKCKCRL